jgi:hypothetical protein
MRKCAVSTAILLVAGVSWGGPLRVALLDFEDVSGMAADAKLGGTIEPGALAAKGVYLLGQQLLEGGSFTLVDRRDFIEQVEKLRPTDDGRATPTRPSFIQAAQSLRTDAVLRGSLMSFSTGKQIVDQGGYRTEFSVASLRVALEALDTVDGAVIALANSSASKKFRQTAATQTVLSEDDVIELMEEAIAKAVPELESALTEREERLANRETVRISVKTSADPALVEIDGILIGSTPLENHEIYKGDHVLTVGKAGHYDVTKRILFENDATIEVPLIRVQLDAEEIKQVLEKARLHIFQGEPGLIINEIKAE